MLVPCTYCAQQTAQRHGVPSQIDLCKPQHRSALEGPDHEGGHLGLLGALARGGLLQALRALGLLAHAALGLLALALLLLLRTGNTNMSA